ncbi:AsmA-like C-terminal region-containing protein, partial [Mammaliicoccus sciuri]|uniref:YhdP family protein n=1 Tax=Mammaliicoccus sciuri TaxID=1296 RepID=UPI00114EF9C3
SLSRRVKLDFTDVFSDGFAFDTISGNATVSKGVFVSDNVHMKGPAARSGALLGVLSLHRSAAG